MGYKNFTIISNYDGIDSEKNVLKVEASMHGKDSHLRETLLRKSYLIREGWHDSDCLIDYFYRKGFVDLVDYSENSITLFGQFAKEEGIRGQYIKFSLINEDDSKEDIMERKQFEHIKRVYNKALEEKRERDEQKLLEKKRIEEAELEKVKQDVLNNHSNILKEIDEQIEINANYAIDAIRYKLPIEFYGTKKSDAVLKIYKDRGFKCGWSTIDSKRYTTIYISWD